MNNIPVRASNEARPDNPLIRLSGESANSTGKTNSSTLTIGPVLIIPSGTRVTVAIGSRVSVGICGGVSIKTDVGVTVADIPQETDKANKPMTNISILNPILTDLLTGQERSNLIPSYSCFLQFLTGNSD
tara:strand:+ start:146 stop:535 length:390 start_codon:yes stop_codon:yes gene_type:complete